MKRPCIVALFLAACLGASLLAPWLRAPQLLEAGEKYQTYPPQIIPTPQAAYTTLASGITSGSTSVTVADGSKFPTDSFRFSIDTELLWCNSRTGNVLDVSKAPPENPTASNGRAIEGTTAASHTQGINVVQRLTAQGLLNAPEAAMGIVIVGGPSKLHGIIGDGITDNTSAFNTLIGTLTNGQQLLLATGKYLISGTVDWSALNCVRLVGTTHRGGDPNPGTIIIGNVAGPLFKMNGTANRYIVEGVNFRNTNATSAAIGLQMWNSNFSIVSNCQFALSAGIGLDMSTSEINVAVEDCIFNGSGNVVGSIGLLMAGTGCSLRGANDFSGCDVALQIFNAGVSMQGGRFETNRNAMKLGIDQNGNTFALSRSEFGGISMEANDVGVQVFSGSDLVFKGIEIAGSTNAPSGNSVLGVDIQGGSALTFESVSPTGTHTNAAFRVSSSIGPACAFRSCIPINNQAGGKVWDVQADDTNIIFDKCNYTSRLDDAFAYPNLRKEGQKFIAARDMLNPTVEGKNLARTGIAISNAVTSQAISFTAQHGAGSQDFTLASSAGGSLANSTYFYGVTTRTAVGESSYFTPRSIANGTNGTVTATYSSGMNQDGARRRLYRGIYQYSGTDLTSSNGNAAQPVVTSASHAFTQANVGDMLPITAGTNAVLGVVQIVSVRNGAATLSGPIASVASVSGLSWGGGFWQGYYEQGINLNALNLVDTGAAFTGLASPPGSGVSSNSMAEPDANYDVYVTFDFSAGSWWVTNKTTTGFTLNWTNASGAANHFGYLIVRGMQIGLLSFDSPELWAATDSGCTLPRHWARREDEAVYALAA